MNNVYLIGCRGVGKTTLAPLLAKSLSWSVVEMDELIAQHAGNSISDIFAQHGEAAFRDHETAVLQEVAGRAGQVVSTGGGIVLRQTNRELLRATGQVIWLTASIPAMYERLQQPGQARPPLTKLGLYDEIEQMARQREGLYAATAHFRVDTSTQKLQDSVSLIVSYLNRVMAHGSV